MRHFRPDPSEIVPAMRISVGGPEEVGFVSKLIDKPEPETWAFMQRATTLVCEDEFIRHGLFFLEPITSSVLEAHMAFYREGRGAFALYAARAGLRYAFEQMKALVVFGRIPVEDRAARLFTRMIGLKSDGIREREPGGPLVEWFEVRADDFGEIA